MIRDLLHRVCVDDLGHVVVGEAGSGIKGIGLIAKLHPDLVVIELALPEPDGVAVIEQVQRIAPGTKLLVVSGSVDDFTIYQINRLGVQGFVDRNTDHLHALRAALIAMEAGKAYFSPAFQHARRVRLQDPAWFAKLLSSSELGVLSLIGRGMNNGEIASHLSISPGTAQKHRSNILRKLHVRGTPKLIVFAQNHGFAVRATAPWDGHGATHF